MSIRCLLCFGFLLWTQTPGYSIDLYVSPNGSDANSGSSDKPLASLAAARDAASASVGKESVTVHVADGVYYLPETLAFSPADSGSQKHPIVYRAEHEGKAVLSGGSRLDLTWTPFRDGVFQARTPAGLVIDQLFIDGRNQRMARYPNYDASKKAEPYQGFAADAFSKERAANWANPTGGYIHAMHRAGWGGYHYRITGKDAGGDVTYEGGWQNNRRMGMHKDHRMVENIFDELDAPGEWFHNAKTLTLYYKPKPDTDLSKVKVEVVRLRHLVEFQGSEKSPVRFITLKGFKVRHAARTFMDCKEQLLRSDWAIYRGGAFMLTGTEDVSILDCEFDQVGGNAVFVNNYNRRVLVKGCHIHDTGASGVCFVGDPDTVRNPLFEYGQKNDLATIDRTPGPKTNNYPAQSAVEDCLIHGIGRVERQPAGVQIEMASEITVRDCSVYDTARAGINIGDGAWGGHLIERCDVFDTVLETHDHGSFNSWGRDRYWRSDHLTASQKAVDAEPNLPFLDAMKTTVIRDSRWRCDHGWDIDLDDGSSNYDIYNNLMLNKGLKLREGFRRHAWNNVMPIGTLHPHVWFQRSKDQVHGNIMTDRYHTARMNEPYTDGTSVDRNLFDSQDSRILEHSAKLGWDSNSVMGEPMYVDPANGDFRVKEDSPALKLGFKNFPMDQFGVKKPALKAIAKTPEIPSLEQSNAPGTPVNITPLKMVWLGATLKDLKGEEFSAFGVSKEAGGVALAAVPKTSMADKAGLKKGDLIQAINGKSVANSEQLFPLVVDFARNPRGRNSGESHYLLKVVRDQKPIELSVTPDSVVVTETAATPAGFKQLPVPSDSGRKVTANRETVNDPLTILTDGKLATGYGPVFPNAVSNGAYRMDLGEVKPVMAITSWSFKQGSSRGAQKLTIYGSTSQADPGWDLSKFTALGTIHSGAGNDAYLAASLRAVNSNTLGNFRWVVWSVSPVSNLGGGENTAFQELAVETLETSSSGARQELRRRQKDRAESLDDFRYKSIELPEVRGHFVRIELPGEDRVLSLAEVSVFEKGTNVALKKKATQSTVGFSGAPSRAVDGNPDGNYLNLSVSHTESNGTDPWWEVDLGRTANVDQVLVYNRTDSHGDRLDDFTLRILDAERKVVFSKEKVPQSAAISFLRAGVKSAPIVTSGNPKRKRGTTAAGKGPAHLFILAGQSNMVGLDPDISFTPAVTKAFGAESVIVVKDAHNSQAISRWVKGWKSVQGQPRKGSGDLYDQMMSRVNDAVAGRDLKTVTLVWMQGEADAAGNQVPVYKASLDGLLGQLRHDLKRDDIRFVIGRLSDYSLDTGKHSQWQAMRELQVAYAEASPLGDWVDTDDLNNKTDPKTGKPKNDVHYTKDGYRIFGQRLAEKAIGLIPRPAFPGVKTDFRGYDRYDRIRTAAGHFSVVCPKEPAPEKPWLWRSLFWEAIRKVSDADLKLVDEGYHVVLAHGDVAGHPSGNANIDAAYDLLTREYGFSKKCSMASMSRGTLSLFRWASANPEKVDSIYVDNGVCNVLSWPAGKLVPGNKSIASGAPGSWEDFKRKFGYATDEEALKTKESPIDQLEPLAKAGVPILMVCGNKDTAVPYEENDAIMEQRYKSLGGSIKVIVEDKGHSHGMNDPTPVLKFIREHTSSAVKVGPVPTGQRAAGNKTAPAAGPHSRPVGTGPTSIAFSGLTWIVDSQSDWEAAVADQSNIEFKDELATPTAKEATFRSVLITTDEKRSARSLTIGQSPVWHNWEPIPNIGPSNLGDAPVMLTVGPGDYWMFGRYGRVEKKKGFESEESELEGFDVPLKTTPFPNQFDAPGGLKKGLGGYHAWQSRDMINWVHHGPVSEAFSSWVTTAEYVDGKLYLYYDYPNDQDPHLYIDDDLTDGLPGKNMGMAFNDPSHGSDCAFIRDRQGNFHVIYEDWSPIDASTHSWDSPLAGHAVSSDGIGNFRILPPAIDVRTKPTGKFAEYPHPHWHATDPKKYPGKPAPVDVPQHRIKAGEVRAFAKYEIHEPEQDAFGDWASICIGGRYYLFADFHPAKSGIRVGWFTSSSLDKPFTFCGEIGKGHPDPDIMFGEGRFYLATQMSTDYVSPGPWVETVEARFGVDTNKDEKIDQWTDWTEVKESYDYVKGFSKQVAKTPATMDLSDLPEGYGFQCELRLTDTTHNASKPILDTIAVLFEE